MKETIFLFVLAAGNTD